MMNVFLFLVTVCIWGTTWLAIAFQVGPVPMPVSVFYRFAAAAVLFLVVLAASRRLHLPRRQDQPWIVAQALCLFCLNFLCFYSAASFVPSGLIAVVFSLSTVLNAFNARLMFGDAIRARTMVAACLGIAGLFLLFDSDISRITTRNLVQGGGLAFLGTCFFSLGNMVSRRNSAHGLSPVMTNAWGMTYGAILLFVLIVFSGEKFVTPPDVRYIGAMIYLAVFGSIIGFTTYLVLLARIGSVKAAYATVLFPVIALVLSGIFEGYIWHWQGGVGLLLTLAGNLVMFLRTEPRRTSVPA